MHREHDDLVAVSSKVDGVRKSRQYRSTRLTIHSREQERVVNNAVNERSDFHGEAVTKVRAARLVPMPCFEDFVFSLWPKDNGGRQALTLQLASNVCPRNRRMRIAHVLGPATIEFSPVFVGKLECRIALRFGQTLPERDRDLRAVVRGKLEQVRQRVDGHG